MKIFIFDFDDTLFPTSQLQNCSKDKLKELSDSIDHIIKKTSEYGKIIIVTNAEKNWVKHCMLNYLSSIELEKNLVNIYSTVDNRFITDKPVSEWKTLAFHSLLHPILSDGDSHEIYCFGDSAHDRRAALSIRQQYTNVLVKSLYLISKPSPNVLIAQHKVILNSLDYLLNFKEHLDLTTTVNF